MKKVQANVRSFRVTDDVMARFKEIQDDLRLTQDSALKMLVDAYELENAKNILHDRKIEISNFQNKASELVAAFLHSLQLNQDAESRIRSEVEIQMKTKDEAISEYQKQLSEERVRNAVLKGFEEDLRRSEENVQILTKKLSEANSEAQEARILHEKQIADKEKISNMLAEKLTAAEEKAEGYDSLMAEYMKIGEDLKASREDLKEQKREEALNLERAENTAEKEKEAASAALREFYIKKIENLTESYQKDKKEREDIISNLKDEIQSVLLQSEKDLRSLEKENAGEIRKLESEKGVMREEIASLKEKLLRKDD